MRRQNPSGALLWLAAYLLGALGFALPASAQTGPTPYTTVSFYFPGGLLAGTVSPAPGGQGNFPATRYSYDGNERLYTVETGYLSTWPSSPMPSGWTSFVVRKMVAYSYDVNGRKVAETVTGYTSGVASGTTNVTQFSYDDLDRLTCTAVRMNLSAALPSSACTLTSQGSYGPDRVTENTYDALNRLTEVQKAVGTSNEEVYATYTYTADSLQRYITDADNNRTELSYDGFDRLSDWYFPSKTTAGTVDTSDYEAYGYDNNGNRTSLKKRDGETITYQYDPLNRMSAKLVPDASQNVSYGYDLRGLMTSAVFSSSGAGITNIFDGFGRMTSTTSTMGGVSRTVSQGFDGDGDRISVTYPDSNYVDYGYDGDDRFADVRENGGATIVSESYDPLMLSGETRGGVTSSYGYDAAERPQSWADSFASTGPNVTITLAYNPANQMITRTRDNDAYAYAAYVNGSTAYAPNGLNQYTTVGGSSVGYDLNGNLTSDNSTNTTYTYDAENRLVSASVNNSSAVSLTYDPLGRLFQVASASGTRQFLYNGDQLVAEYNGTTGAMLRRYVQGPAGDEPLVWYEGAAVSSVTRRSLQADYQGSIQSVANASGNVIGINRYDEYGVPSADNLGTFQYTGQAWLPEIGLYYYKARMYNPRLGRFMQTDPIGYKDDLDLYAYVGNDPLDRTDPTGEISWDDFLGDLSDWLDTASQAANANPELLGPLYGPELEDASVALRGLAEGSEATGEATEATVNLADHVPELEAAPAKETGSYTNIHESGREYHGKGSRARSQVSGRRVEAETGDKHVATDWKASSSDQQAFVDEAKRIEQGGGVKSPNNYNKINSPGNKPLQSQQEQKPMGVVKICNGPCDWER